MRVGLVLLRCFFVVLVVAIPSLAQTANDFEKRYGSPTKEYKLRPDVMLMAKSSRSCVAWQRRHRPTRRGPYNTRLERTRHERASMLSCVGAPLKRRVGHLLDPSESRE